MPKTLKSSNTHKGNSKGKLFISQEKVSWSFSSYCWYFFKENFHKTKFLNAQILFRWILQFHKIYFLKRVILFKTLREINFREKKSNLFETKHGEIRRDKGVLDRKLIQKFMASSWNGETTACNEMLIRKVIHPNTFPSL